MYNDISFIYYRFTHAHGALVFHVFSSITSSGHQYVRYEVHITILTVLKLCLCKRHNLKTFLLNCWWSY